MKKMVLEIFQREIEKQCKFAIIAIDQIKTGLANNNSDVVWYAIQNILVAAAIISKIFWPPYRISQKRGEELRKNLGVENDSPIRSRDFRNDFEHFDERLETWATSSKRHNFIDSNIGPSNMIAGIDQQVFLRHFDPTTWTLTFKGNKYELIPIIKVIHDLYSKVYSRGFNRSG